MISKKDSIVCFYGAEVILRYISAFRKEYPGVLRSRDIEFVHRMRVASRRLNIALAIFHNCYPGKRLHMWQKDIDKATDILGRVRDLDIQSMCIKGLIKELPEPEKRPGVRRLLLRTIQKRKRVQDKLLTILDELDTHQTLVGIEIKSRAIDNKNGSPESNLVESSLFAYPVITRALEKLLSYDLYVDKIEAVEELHAMRIASKQLRYTLEIFAPIYKDGLKEVLSSMRMIQEYLGIIHDCDVWEMIHKKFVEDERRRTIEYLGNDRGMNRLIPGFDYFFDIRREQRNKTYTDFVKYWNELRVKDIWGKLQKDITPAGNID